MYWTDIVEIKQASPYLGGVTENLK